MIRSAFVAALRNLARHRLYGFIGLFGLATGFATVLLIGLYVLHEHRFERFLSGHEGVYRLSSSSKLASRASGSGEDVRGPIAAQFRARFPQVVAIAELWNTFGTIAVRRGDVESREPGFTWADPEVFEVLHFPVAAGDLRTALASPDGLVLTRRMARKYFGTDLPIGETLEVDRMHVLRVTAVLEDLPSSTHLNTELFGSSLALPPTPVGNVYRAFVYLRLAPGTSPESIRAQLPDFADHLVPSATTGRLSTVLEFHLTPIADIHLGATSRSVMMKPGGDPQRLAALVDVAALILIVAIINFVNLMSARASRRAVEVCIRKTAGATRAQIALQFTSEAILHAALAMLLALVVAELALPRFAAFVDSDLQLDYLQPAVVAVLLGLVLGVGVIAGAYPAFVLAAFRPAKVLKGTVAQSVGHARLRELLVLLQFAVLIVLLLAAVVIQLQTEWALRQGLRFDQARLITVHMADDCEHSPFRAAVEALPGVAGAACEGEFLSNVGTQRYRRPDGGEATLQNARVGPGLFELLGLKAVAGRLFDAGSLEQAMPDRPSDRDLGRRYPTIINQAAVRALGYPSAAAAIGQTFVSVSDVRPGTQREIVGVVSDFARESVRAPIAASFYDVGPGYILDVKMREGDVRRTVEAVRSLWRRYAPAIGPIEMRFYDQYVVELYSDLRRQGTMIATLTAIAVMLAGVGLLGLAAFAVERRTREIGVRKALGAQTSNVLRLLLWQFARPVLWANLIAWPVAAWLMNRWLQGFAYRVDLPLWPFPAAAAAALLMMVLTVGAHALLVARARPVEALRYE